MLSRLPISSAQLKAGNNSHKLQNEIRQLLYSLHHSKKLTKQLFMNKYLWTLRIAKLMNLINLDHIYQINLILKTQTNTIALGNVSIYYTWKNIKSTYNNNKSKISAPTWNDIFDLPEGFYSIEDIQDYFETLTENLPAQIYPDKIKNKTVFKIKTGYTLELLSLETMILLGSTKKDVDQDKDGEDVSKLEMLQQKQE